MLKLKSNQGKGWLIRIVVHVIYVANKSYKKCPLSQSILGTYSMSFFVKVSLNYSIFLLT